MALAHAIVEYIHDQIGAKTLFSTHYHELTSLEETLPRLVNVHAQCIEKNGKVVFLHRIIPGGADRSYGIHVAELAGLPVPVIKRAKQLLNELEGRMETSAVAKEPAEDDLSGQLSLFDYQSTKMSHSVPQSGTGKEPDRIEMEIIQALKEWDLMNKTPFECMQFLYELKQKLNR
jgi:DNA mismatch repair protein MutS